MVTTLNRDAIFISNDEVKRVSTIKDFIDIIEQAYFLYGQGDFFDFPRHTLSVPSPNEKRKSLKLMAAACPKDGVMGGYVYSGGFRQNRGWQKCFLLYDFARGYLKAVIECEYLSWLKTGAVSAVAAKYLSRMNSKTVGIFGSGKQAVTQLEGLCQVRNITLIKVFSRNEYKRQAFCQMMSDKLKLPVLPVSKPEEVIEESDIIVTATSSKTPVFHGSLLKEGMHVNAIGAHYPDIRELDREALIGKKVVVDTFSCLEEAGEFVLAGLGIQDIYGELGEVVSQKKQGRSSSSEITIFKSAGRGFEYLALTNYVYRQLRK